MENWTKILACKFCNFVLKCTLEGGGNDMRKKEKRTYRGFTLIELVIVITILAILAAVAIPAFQNLTIRARDASAQGAVGGLRSAIAVYRANELANNRAGAYPALNGNAFSAGQNPMENSVVPSNPWCTIQSAGCVATGLVASPDASTAARQIVGSSAQGWAYHAASGLIYANSNTSTGGTTENNF